MTRRKTNCAPERSNIMKKAKKAAEIQPYDEELDTIEPEERGICCERLILKKDPPPRKEQLIAHGAREIRCSYCGQIRPIASAEEFEDGWICEGCFAEAVPEQRYGGQRGR
jgi:hypothetical protein